MNPQILTVVTGISGIFGLMGLLSYLYFQLQISRAERSVREVVEGEGLFNADQVVEILKQFSDDAARLEALKTFTHHDGTKAKNILTKVTANVDVERLTNISSRNYRNISKATALVFSVFAVIGLVYYQIVPPQIANIAHNTATSNQSNISIPTVSLVSYSLKYQFVKELITIEPKSREFHHSGKSGCESFTQGPNGENRSISNVTKVKEWGASSSQKLTSVGPNSFTVEICVSPQNIPLQGYPPGYRHVIYKWDETYKTSSVSSDTVTGNLTGDKDNTVNLPSSATSFALTVTDSDGKVYTFNKGGTIGPVKVDYDASRKTITVKALTNGSSTTR